MHDAPIFYLPCSKWSEDDVPWLFIDRICVCEWVISTTVFYMDTFQPAIIIHLHLKCSKVWLIWMGKIGLYIIEGLHVILDLRITFLPIHIIYKYMPDIGVVPSLCLHFTPEEQLQSQIFSPVLQQKIENWSMIIILLFENEHNSKELNVRVTSLIMCSVEVKDVFYCNQITNSSQVFLINIFIFYKEHKVNLKSCYINKILLQILEICNVNSKLIPVNSHSFVDIFSK